MSLIMLPDMAIKMIEKLNTKKSVRLKYDVNSNPGKNENSATNVR